MAQRKKAAAHGSTQTYWLAAAGLMFVLGSFAMLLRESVTGGRPVAEISIRVDEIVPSAQGFLVSLKIDNTGNGTAAALNVEGCGRGGTMSKRASSQSTMSPPDRSATPRCFSRTIRARAS